VARPLLMHSYGQAMTLLERRIFLGLVVLVTAAFLWMVRGFFVPIFWAAVLAILFQPAYQRALLELRGSRSAAAGITTLLVVFVVLIPASLLVTALARQALSLYNRALAGDINLLAPVTWVEQQIPAVTEYTARFGVDMMQVRSSVEAAAIAATQWVATRAVGWGQNLLLAALFFALMLYFLFFFFRDGERIVAGIVRALPMGQNRERRLLDRFALVARATVKGTLVVAAVQGALGGILFAIAGIDAALFWGVVMGVLSLLPAVGPALVWIPAAAILVAMGMFWQAGLVVVGGAVVIGLADNVLRPILVGRAVQMPDYLVLIATLGGLSAFGLAGFVAGPVIAALFLVIWDMFATEYAPVIVAEPFPVTVHPAAGQEPATAASPASAPPEPPAASSGSSEGSPENT
jgi:predicted PurR-regulated permease PerM